MPSGSTNAWLNLAAATALAVGYLTYTWYRRQQSSQPHSTVGELSAVKDEKVQKPHHGSPARGIKLPLVSSNDAKAGLAALKPADRRPVRLRSDEEEGTAIRSAKAALKKHVADRPARLQSDDEITALQHARESLKKVSLDTSESGRHERIRQNKGIISFEDMVQSTWTMYEAGQLEGAASGRFFRNAQPLVSRLILEGYCVPPANARECFQMAQSLCRVESMPML
jgi:hypothetical protein